MTLFRSPVRTLALAAVAFTALALPAEAGERRDRGERFEPRFERDFARDGTRFDRGFRSDFEEVRRGRHAGRCRPRRALRKARRLGVRRAYIHRVGPRGVVIRGRARGERVAVRFGPARFCPVRNVRVRGYRGYRG